jgi:hypothetical protein
MRRQQSPKSTPVKGLEGNEPNMSFQEPDVHSKPNKGTAIEG